MALDRRSFMMVGAVAVIVGVLAGCGDPISVNYGWKAQGNYVLIPDKNDNGFTTTTSGMLLDNLERPLAGTYFSERCFEPPAQGLEPPQTCFATINTGRRVYVASGTTPTGPFGTFKSLASSASRDTIVVSRIVGNNPDQQPPYLLLVSIHNNG
ncbi:MAG TPA: hypothetical protein VHZ96_08665 [Frankiaceae bacterium]|nr:hypothetical protein [Frankiaceae bacterium]